MSNKAAILDSDFIIKTSLTKNLQNSCFADVVLKLPYKFYCHEQNKIEVTDYTKLASNWLENNIKSKRILCISDLDILYFIKQSYQISQNFAVNFYSDWLKQSCDIFTKTFYETNYKKLETLKQKSEIITDKEFLCAVKSGDNTVGKNNNLGEIKDSLLAITLNQCLQMECINFCSDDNIARRSLLAFSLNNLFSIKCISYMGFYWLVKQKNLLTKDEATDYLCGWKNYCKSSELYVTIKQYIHRKQPDYPKLNIDILFSAIWNDEVVMVNDGYLVYKSELQEK